MTASGPLLAWRTGWRAKRVLIVASGPSARSASPVDLAATSAKIIAVNGAIDWLPRADWFFTLDPSPANMARMRKRKPWTTYVCAAPPSFDIPAAVARLERKFDPNRVLGILPTLSEDREAINTGNSAWGALGFAYHMRPERIAFIGLDGSQEERVEGGKPRDLSHLPALFASAKPQLKAAGIEVFNGSPESAVICFRRGTANEALDWLEEE